MFCPRCRAEYREGFLKCVECNIDLVSELPPEPESAPEPEQNVEYNNLVNIETYCDVKEAEFAKGLLSANGIYGVVKGDEEGGYEAPLSGVSSVQLLVKGEGAWEATKFLDEIKKSNNALEPTPRENTIKKIAIGVLCLVGLFLIICIFINLSF